MSGTDWRAAAEAVRALPAELVFDGRGVGSRGPCPIHNGTGDNFAVYQGEDGPRWHCHSDCKGGGDTIAYVAALRHGWTPGGPAPRGEAFFAAVRELLELGGEQLSTFVASSARKGKPPAPPLEEVHAVLEHSGTLKPTDDRLLIGGRERPGIGSRAQLVGLSLRRPLVLELDAGWLRSEGPTWARTWKGWALGLYDARGELVSLHNRPVGPRPKARNPKGCSSAGLVLANDQAAGMLAGDREGKRTAEEHGVIIVEGAPAFLAYASWAPGPVIGLPGHAPAAATLRRIPRAATVLVDTDPDEAGAGYLRRVLEHLEQHADVRWSKRAAWSLSRDAAAMEREIKALRSSDAAFADPDERAGRAAVIEGAGFAPVPSDVRATVREAAEQRKAATGPRGRVEVHALDDELATNDRVIAALVKRPDLYERAGQVVEVRDGRIIVVGPPRMRELVTSTVQLFTFNEKGEKKAAKVPRDMATQIVARKHWPGMRKLEGVVAVPVLRPDGTVLDRPGYDEATGLYYTPTLELAALPFEPGPEDVRAALELILGKLRHFPFKDPSDRGTALAILLTPFARHTYHGPTSPLGWVNATAAGSGKSILAAGLARIASGGQPARLFGWNRSEAEQGKQITSAALRGDPVILLDNVRGDFGNPTVEQALTLPDAVWSDRLLGGNESFSGPFHAMWLATSNNANPAGDMRRRVMVCRLESPETSPERRAGLPPFVEDLMASRADVTRAALVLLRAWFAAGRPTRQLPALGSFEGWTGVVRQCVAWLGAEHATGAAWMQLADPELSRERDMDDVSSEHNAESTLLLELREFFGLHGGPRREMKAGEFVRKYEAEKAKALQHGFPTPRPDLEDALDVICDARTPLAIGKLFAQMRDAWHATDGGDLRLCSRRGKGGVMVWRVDARPRGAPLDEPHPDPIRTPPTQPHPTHPPHPHSPNDSNGLRAEGGVGGVGGPCPRTRAHAHARGARVCEGTTSDPNPPTPPSADRSPEPLREGGWGRPGSPHPPTPPTPPEPTEFDDFDAEGRPLW